MTSISLQAKQPLIHHRACKKELNIVIRRCLAPAAYTGRPLLGHGKLHCQIRRDHVSETLKMRPGEAVIEVVYCRAGYWLQLHLPDHIDVPQLLEQRDFSYCSGGHPFLLLLQPDLLESNDLSSGHISCTIHNAIGALTDLLHLLILHQNRKAVSA